MFQDLFLRMDYQQVVFTNAPSQSYIDFLAAGDSVPDGTLAMWKVIVSTTFTLASAGLNTATMQFQLQTDSTTTFQSANAFTIMQSTNILITNLIAQSATPGAAPSASTAGQYTIAVAGVIPFGCLRYVRGYYSIAASSPTINAGAVTSEIILNSDKIISYNLGSLLK